MEELFKLSDIQTMKYLINNGLRLETNYIYIAANYSNFEFFIFLHEFYKQQVLDSDLLIQNSIHNPSIKVFTFLLDKYPQSINCKILGEEPILIYAVQWDEYHKANILIQRGCDINAKDNMGKSFFDYIDDWEEFSKYRDISRENRDISREIKDISRKIKDISRENKDISRKIKDISREIKDISREKDCIKRK